jgi:hypothetical protein
MNSLGLCPHTLAVYEGDPHSSATRVFPAPLLLPWRLIGPDGLKPIDNVGGSWVALGRDETGVYRCIEVNTSVATKEAARSKRTGRIVIRAEPSSRRSRDISGGTGEWGGRRDFFYKTITR